MNASEVLFRCSGLGHLMTEAKSKSELLGETCKTHLVDVFVSHKYGRKEDKQNKFLEKGNEREEDSVTLLSRVSKIFFTKNETHLNNAFIKGTPDLFIGKSINEATETFDTKTSWSAHTFFRASKTNLDKMYYWQGQGYMALSGAKKHTVAYCLVNGTANAITSEKRKLSWQMNIIDGAENPEYIEKCKQIEINHIFDIAAFEKEYPWFEFHNDIKDWKFDIPKEERVFVISFQRSDEDIHRMYIRIVECRNYMNENLYKVAPEPADFV